MRHCEKSHAVLESFAPKIKAQSTMAPQMLVALARSLAAPEQIVLRCEEEEMVRSVVSCFNGIASIFFQYGGAGVE